MKLFLSSEGVPRPDLLRELLGVNAGDIRVALINNAQDPYEEDVAKERETALSLLFCSLGFQTTNVDLRKYENKTNELAEELRKCNLIWCAGGNVFWLRYVMKISGFDTIIRGLLLEGIVYGGWSAGSVVAGPSLRAIDLMDNPNEAPEIIWEGLELVDFFVWPHWDKEKYVPIQRAALEKMKLLPCKSLILKDGEVVIVENGQRRIVS